MHMELEEENLFKTAQRIIAEGNVIFCPSLGEYPVYDELLYNMMGEDAAKMNAYEQAIRKAAKDKIAVDIGTGSGAPLALMCAAAGAKQVYAIEAGAAAAQQAGELIRSKKLEDKIKIVHGCSSAIELPEKAGLCVSEIIGNIGSSEGVISILNDARRFLKSNAGMIPGRCVTNIAPVCLPQKIYDSDLLKEVVNGYIERIYQTVGFKFPLTRYAVYNFPESNIIAEPEIFEDIRFDRNPDAETLKTVEFSIRTDCEFDGLLLWIDLYVDENSVINAFDSVSWPPVYLNAGKKHLKENDVIKIDCARKLSKNLLNPDYFFAGSIFRHGRAIDSFNIDSYYTTA